VQPSPRVQGVVVLRLKLAGKVMSAVDCTAGAASLSCHAPEPVKAELFLAPIDLGCAASCLLSILRGRGWTTATIRGSLPECIEHTFSGHWGRRSRFRGFRYLRESGSSRIVFRHLGFGCLRIRR